MAISGPAVFIAFTLAGSSSLGIFCCEFWLTGGFQPHSLSLSAQLWWYDCSSVPFTANLREQVFSWMMGVATQNLFLHKVSTCNNPSVHSVNLWALKHNHTPMSSAWLHWHNAWSYKNETQTVGQSGGLRQWLSRHFCRTLLITRAKTPDVMDCSCTAQAMWHFLRCSALKLFWKLHFSFFMCFTAFQFQMLSKNP